MTPAVNPTTAESRLALLRRFLQAYWLRPENAFWMTLRSEMLARVGLTRPAIDLGCGDGVFTFLYAGGAFDPAFDVFQAVGRLDDVRDRHADMFDHLHGEYAPPIVTAPARRVDVGSDLKPNLLHKAGALGLYERLVLHDGNDPLPWDAESFETVYCNAAYWVENIDGFLGELGRIVRPDGKIVLQVKLAAMADYTLEAHRDVLGERFLDIIGRGRLGCWPSVADRATWERRFAAAGLTIVSADAFITRTHAHIWDIGLRPIAPLLVKMANALTPENRAAIKRDWVDLFCELLAPLCDPAFDLFATPAEPAEIQYVLQRR